MFLLILMSPAEKSKLRRGHISSYRSGGVQATLRVEQSAQLMLLLPASPCIVLLFGFSCCSDSTRSILHLLFNLLHPHVGVKIIRGGGDLLSSFRYYLKRLKRYVFSLPEIGLTEIQQGKRLIPTMLHG